MPTTPPDHVPTDAEYERLVVAEDVENDRFDLLLDSTRVGLADFYVQGSVLTITHVETDPAYRGRHFAARLMAGILDDLRVRQLTVVPQCPYALAYMRDHPEQADLLAP